MPCNSLGYYETCDQGPQANQQPGYIGFSNVLFTKLSLFRAVKSSQVLESSKVYLMQGPNWPQLMPMFVKETMPLEKRKVESRGTTHVAGSGGKVPRGEIGCAGEARIYVHLLVPHFFILGKRIEVS